MIAFLLALTLLTAPIQPASDTLRVLAYNIKHGLGMDGQVELERAAAVTRRLDPDVVLLQEIDSSTTRTGGVRQARFLSEHTGLEHYAFGAFMPYQGGGYGMAMLARWPLHEVENHRLPPGPEPRTTLAAHVSVGGPEGPEVIVAGIHLYGSRAERLAQARTLVETFEDAEVPVILAGDFNSRPDSDVMELLGRYWSLADKGPDHFTFPSDAPDREIDYVLYRPPSRFEVVEHDVIDEPLVSDHRPVLLEVVIPNDQ